jgi:hypothetical protein
LHPVPPAHPSPKRAQTGTHGMGLAFAGHLPVDHGPASETVSLTQTGRRVHLCAAHAPDRQPGTLQAAHYTLGTGGTTNFQTVTSLHGYYQAPPGTCL